MRPSVGPAHRPKNILLGMRKDALGRPIEHWANPEDLREEAQAGGRLISLVGMAGATGITGMGLGRLLDRYGPRYERKEFISRREFMRTSAAVAAAGAIACGDGGDGPTGPEDDPVARISGPSDLQPARLGMPVLAEFDGGESTPASFAFHWHMKKVEDALQEGDIALGQNRTTQALLARPGKYAVTLRISSYSDESTAVHKITVHPPPLPGDDYPLISFFRKEYRGSGHAFWALHVMDPVSGEIARIGGNPEPLFQDHFYAQTATWERGGGRLATEISRQSAGLSVVVYDLLKDEITKVSHPQATSAWTAAWNPQKDWIAFAEGRRGSLNEPVLVRPDGSERLYLSGNSYDPEVSGAYPSWSPDGERLALGWTLYGHTGPSRDRRNSIYSGFWDGNVSRTQIPTEAQLMAFLDSFGENTSDNRRSINPCNAGLAWSPDGAWLAYTMRFGFADGEGSQEYLLKSRVDGTGDIEILVRGENAPGSQHSFLNRPIWSPDGSEVYFSAHLKPWEIMKVSADGGTPSYVTSGQNDWAGGWYG